VKILIQREFNFANGTVTETVSVTKTVKRTTRRTGRRTTAQTNEGDLFPALLRDPRRWTKMLCRNPVVLIHEMYELGIARIFETEAPAASGTTVAGRL
jgi:hypothetical protein